MEGVGLDQRLRCLPSEVMTVVLTVDPRLSEQLWTLQSENLVG